jgi:hypothetical protein
LSQNLWCHSCGRRYQIIAVPERTCRFCSCNLEVNANSPAVRARLEKVAKYVDGLSAALAKQRGYTPYFCWKVLTCFSKDIFPTFSGQSDYLREQDLYDYLCEGPEDSLDEFLNKFASILEHKVGNHFFRRMLAPDVFRITDAAGKRIGYTWEHFESDLMKMRRFVPEFSGFETLQEILDYLVGLYVRENSDKFFELLYIVHDGSRQAEYWQPRSGASLVTAGSKVGRRAPEWGWD